MIQGYNNAFRGRWLSSQAIYDSIVTRCRKGVMWGSADVDQLFGHHLPSHPFKLKDRLPIVMFFLLLLDNQDDEKFTGKLPAT